MGKNFSANNTTDRRKQTDFYETPYSLTREFLDVEKFDKSLSVCEPACGKGAITKVLNEYWDKDLITSYDQEVNFLWETGNYNSVITNPPYTTALQFIDRAKRVATEKFAFLLPLSYLHGKQRYDEIYTDREYGLKKVYVFTRYPMLGEKIREDGKYRTGMMVYAWFVWENGHSGLPMIDWLDNNEDVLSKKDIEKTEVLTDNPLSDILDS